MKQFFTGLIIGLSVMFLIAAVGKGPNMENGGYDGGEVYAGHFPKYMPPYWLVGYMAGASDMYHVYSGVESKESLQEVIHRMRAVYVGAEAQNLSTTFLNRVPLGTGACGGKAFEATINAAEKGMRYIK